MSWVVRESVDEDVPELLRLMKELVVAHHFDSTIVKSNQEDLLRDGFGDDDAKQFHVVVAECKTEGGSAADGQIVGYALYILHYSGLGEQGIGRALMTKVAEMATHLNCFKLEWRCLDSNSGAVAFYNSLGAYTVDKATVLLVMIERQGIEQLVVKSVQLHSDIKICYGTKEDIPAVIMLLKELAVVKGDDINCIKFCETDFLQDGFSEPKRFYLVLAKVRLDGTDDEELVGFGSFSFSYSTVIAAGLIVHIEDFYVKKEYKNDGDNITTALIKKIAEFAREHNCCKISLKYAQDDTGDPAFLEGLEVTRMPDWSLMYLDTTAMASLLALPQYNS